MRSRPRLAGVALLVFGLLAPAGCQPAGRYSRTPSRPTHFEVHPAAPIAAPTAKTESAAPAPLPVDYTWMEPTPSAISPVVPLVFVHADRDRATWAKLTHDWNPVQLPPRPALPIALLGGSPVVAAGLTIAGPVERAVQIKVPLGLADPTARLPASNAPTLAKWELGKRLFFEADYLLPPNPRTGFRQSCAGCHQPAHGFTQKAIRSRPAPTRTPTLINTVFNTRQFADGRVRSLEEVVQHSRADERDTDGVPAQNQHSWSGIVARLRDRPDYVERFKKAFGTPPTQDAIGKALATYLRTILSGNSIQDRAEQGLHERGGATLEARDYEAVLDDAALKALAAPEKPAKDETAKQMLAGYQLFHGKAACVRCHGGRSYSDHGFHNIGVGDSAITALPGQEVGRFATLPIGLKDRRMIGAFQTPSLRALPRTAPYFHDGLRHELFEVVVLHVRPRPASPYLDPEIRERHLTETEIHALVMFLKALDGDALPSEVTVAEPKIEDRR